MAYLHSAFSLLLNFAYQFTHTHIFHTHEDRLNSTPDRGGKTGCVYAACIAAEAAFLRHACSKTPWFNKRLEE